MADLKFVDQHNMVACLEKIDKNVEFHQIVDFLSTCSLNYALTVSPTIYASYIEQFWNTAISKTVNSVKQIHDIVDGKVVVISESSVRSDLLFNDEDGIACLTNDEFFENLALMGYEQLSTKLTFQKDHGADKAIYKEGGDSMKRAITTDASLAAAQYSDNILKIQSTAIPNVDIPQGMDTGSTPRRQKTIGVLLLRLGIDGNLYLIDKKGSCLKGSKDCSRQSRVESSGDDLDEEDASKHGRESDKTKSMFQDNDFDAPNDDMEDVKGETVHTATTRVSVISAPVTTAGVAISTGKPRTPPITTTIFSDEDLTIAQTLIKMKEEKAKEKGVAIKDVEDSPSPIGSITTLQPLPTIDPKDKAQRLHEEELAELDRAQKERQKQEEATSVALGEEFDEIQARIDVDHELVIRLTHEEQQKYTIEERARLLAEFFERRKKQLAAERAEAIRNKPPTRTQIRIKIITYLKHIDNDSQQQAESTKNRPRANFEEEISKKQKLEEDTNAKKEELRDSIDVAPRDDVAIDVESLATKYPIVDWKTHI
ncbi:hypothetical protein Tco_0115500 [Tanacetum coccineum]